MTLGNKIRNCRIERGMTQVELALKSGLSQGYISQLEKDKFNPTIPVIIGIAAGLDVPIERFIEINNEWRAV